MKRFVVLCLVVVFLASCTTLVDVPDEPPTPGNGFELITGRVIDYEGLGFSPALFSIDTTELTYEISDTTKTLQITANDDAIYKYGYYSINGSAWQQFEIPTSTLLGGNWYTGATGYSLQLNKADVNESSGNYVILYSCTREGLLWNCHDDQWQIVQFNIVFNTVPVDPKQTAWDATTSLFDFYYESWDTYQQDSAYTTQSQNGDLVGSWQPKGSAIPSGANLYWVGSDINVGQQWYAPTGSGTTRARYYDFGDWDRFVDIHNGWPKQYQSQPGQIDLDLSHEIVYVFRRWYGADYELLYDQIKVWGNDSLQYVSTPFVYSADNTDPIKGENDIMRVQRNGTNGRTKVWLNSQLVFDFVESPIRDVNELKIGTNAHPLGHHARALLIKDGSHLTDSEWSTILSQTNTIWPRGTKPDFPYLDIPNDFSNGYFDDTKNGWNATQHINQGSFSGGSGTPGTHTIQWYYANADLGPNYLDYHAPITGATDFFLDRDNFKGAGQPFNGHEGDSYNRVMYVVTPYDDQGTAGLPQVSHFTIDSRVGTPEDTCTNSVQDGDETGVDCGGSCPNACGGAIISDTNFCTQATTNVTACHSHFNRMEVLVDGDTSTYDDQFNNCAEDPEWWEFQFDQPRLLGKIRFYERTFFDGWIATSPLYYVEYWTGSAWAQVSNIQRNPANVDGSNTGGSWHNVTFDPVTTTAFRLNTYKAGSQTFTGMREVECFEATALHCSNSVQDGDETGVDCGGSCLACASCSDGIQNQDETGIDCGGVCVACPVDGDNDGYVLGVDCDDANNTVYQNLTGYVDADGDSYTTGGAVTVCSGASLPSGYQSSSTATDCNDGLSSINPGAFDICDDGIDQDCSGADRTCSGGSGHPYADQIIDFTNTSLYPNQFKAYFPPDYDPDSGTEYPLLIFLHGLGESGTDLSTVDNHGPLKHVYESWWNYPFIVVAPLTDVGRDWQNSGPNDDLYKTILEIRRNFPVDDSRLYMTGLSLGAMGTYTFLVRRPGVITAAVPISGTTNAFGNACTLKQTPMWMFVGDNDGGYTSQTRSVMDRAQYQCGAPMPDPDIKLTMYEGTGHSGWTRTYDPYGAANQYTLDTDNCGTVCGDLSPYGVVNGAPTIYDWLLTHVDTSDCPGQNDAACTTTYGTESDIETYGANTMGIHGTPFAVYVPPGYHSDMTKKWPVLMFLHGAGQNGPTDGSELSDTWVLGPLKFVQQGEDFPFIIVAPQTTSSTGWSISRAYDVYVKMHEYFRIDEQRFYLTGLSLGAGGTYNFLRTYPDRMAAGIPVSAWGGSYCVIKEKHPIWAFHNDNDQTVGTGSGVAAIQTMEFNCGEPSPDPQIWMTLFDGGNHGQWDRFYDPTPSTAAFPMSTDTNWLSKLEENTPYGADYINMYQWVMDQSRLCDGPCVGNATPGDLKP